MPSRIPLIYELLVEHNMRLRTTIPLVLMGLACAVVLALLMVSQSRGGRDSRLPNIERTRSLVSAVSRHESSPVVQAISKAANTNLTEYLAGKALAQEKEAHKAGELVSLSIWAPSLRAQEKWREFFLKSRTNSAHFVAWSFSTEDILTGYVRPEEVRFWQSELCETTNPVAWKDLRLVKLRGDRPECRLPDGSPVSLEAWQNWLNESIAAGWQVGVSLVQSNSGTAVVACRKRAQAGAQPNASPLNGGPVNPSNRSDVTKGPPSVI